MADRLEPPKLSYFETSERFYTLWYSRAEAAEGDGSQEHSLPLMSLQPLQTHSLSPGSFSAPRLTCRPSKRVGEPWIEGLRDGSLKRSAKTDLKQARRLMESALECWQRMPFSGITLAELGAELTGDTHALDRGTALASHLNRALKVRCGIDGHLSAVCRREAWETVGVVVDRLSAPALTFNLMAKADSFLECVLNGYRGLEQPGYLSFQNLSEENPFVPLPESMRCVYVVENPSLVEVACARLGKNCTPLVCTEG
jgi:uncharacterized protein (TIGR02679 family)